jgi:hypothetical protein
VSRPWWQDAVVHQVYPRSLADTDGDGIGDLTGSPAPAPGRLSAASSSIPYRLGP